MTFQLRIGRAPLCSQGDDPDIVVALNLQAAKSWGRISVRAVFFYANLFKTRNCRWPRA